MITGSVYISLARESSDWMDQGSDDRRALAVLRTCPDGASVVIDVGSRQYVSEDAAIWIQEEDHRLQIDIRGTDPTAVMRFVQAARAGTWSVVA